MQDMQAQTRETAHVPREASIMPRGTTKGWLFNKEEELFQNFQSQANMASPWDPVCAHPWSPSCQGQSHLYSHHPSPLRRPYGPWISQVAA